MKEEILSITAGQELNSLIVQYIFGFRHYKGDEVPEFHLHISKFEEQEVWVKETETGFNRYCTSCGNLPEYSTDISYASAMEEALYAMSTTMKLKYTMKLLDLLNIGTFRSLSNLARLIRATPEQRCKAALLAVTSE